MSKAKNKNQRSPAHRVRLIGGRFGSQFINFPSDQNIRPTASRVRETLFNWLTPHIENAHCLDLFCGSGILGLEALSRGAKSVLFIDVNQRITERICQHLDRFACRTSHVITADSLQWLRQKADAPFDIIFLDPPYGHHLLTPCISALNQQGYVKKNTCVYIEHEHQISLSLPANWHIHREKKTQQVTYYLILISH